MKGKEAVGEKFGTGGGSKLLYLGTRPDLQWSDLESLIILLVQFVFIFVLEGIGFVPALIVWVWAIYDAYQEAERINAKRGFG